MLKNAERILSNCRLLPPGSTVLCALSGGADSMCLAHLLSRRPGLTLHAAHFDHCLRGAESEEDARFVQRWCQEHHIPLHLGRGDVAAQAKALGTGIEETARQMRYAFLRETAGHIGAQIIATAHNADDNAETILLHLIRGTGLSGLCGIPPRRGDLIRPLITTSRAEILAYLDHYQIPHREDSSNLDPTYARNRLRTQVMPVLQALNPQAAAHMGRTAAELASLDGWLDQQVQPYLSQIQTGPGRVSVPVCTLSSAPQPLQPRILLGLLDTLRVGRKDFGAIHLQALLELREGGQLNLPQGVTACRKEGLLTLTLTPLLPSDAPLLPHQSLTWGPWRLTLLKKPRGQGLSLGLGDRLTVRPCPPRERLTLPGSNGPRTVKRLCRDRSIPPACRDALPAFYVDGRLAAVWPLGVDCAFVPQGELAWFIQIKTIEKDDEP